jgi:NAD(P)-dependent dehydrogenase (short-subunit alcohol dehydrogenase family)
MDLTGKTILVVGGAAGIGAATAVLCAQRGAQVIVADLDTEAGLQIAASTGGLFLPVDVTDEASVQSMVNEVAMRYLKLDVLVQTAGILQGAYTPLEEFTSEMFRYVWEVNVMGMFLCLKYTQPLLKQSGKGVALLLTSPAGSSKGGVSGLGITAAQKLSEDGIRVNLVAPGGINTAMKRSVIAEDARRRGIDQDQALSGSNLGTPEGVANVLAWLCSDDADYVRGLVSTR